MMTVAHEAVSQMRFACTRCGACCNRAPEVELGEAAGLADQFVFRLMFRLYELPRAKSADRRAADGRAFYETKRLLEAFAARKYPVKRKQGGKTIALFRYLTLSALTPDTRPGARSALRLGRCSIYDRRPLACRAVPFHYSRPEALASRALQAFVETPGHACDTGETAAVVIADDAIVEGEFRQARRDALVLAERDGRWRKAIAGRMRANSRHSGLPSLTEIEANASLGATTVSMGVAWRIAVEAGLTGHDTFRNLVAAQAALIDRELARPASQSALGTLAEMRTEYAEAARA